MRARRTTIFLLLLLVAATGVVVVAGLRCTEESEWATDVVRFVSGFPPDDLLGRVGSPLGLPFARRTPVFVRFRTVIDGPVPR